MKNLVVGMMVLISASSVFARTSCAEQAQRIAEAAYAESMRSATQVGETRVSVTGHLSYEFNFSEGSKSGTKIKVKMVPQADPGTHCEINNLSSSNY